MSDRSKLKQRPNTTMQPKLQFDRFSQNTLATDRDFSSLAFPKAPAKEVVHESISEADKIKFKIPKGKSAIKLSYEKSRECSAPKEPRTQSNLIKEASHHNLSKNQSSKSEEQEIKREQIQQFYHKQLKEYEDEGMRLKSQIMELLAEGDDFGKLQELAEQDRADVEGQIGHIEKEIKQSRLKNARLQYEIEYERKNIQSIKTALQSMQFPECEELREALRQKEGEIKENERQIDDLIVKLNSLKLQQINRRQIERENIELEQEYEKLKRQFNDRIQLQSCLDRQINHLWQQKQNLLKEIRSTLRSLK